MLLTCDQCKDSRQGWESNGQFDIDDNLLKVTITPLTLSIIISWYFEIETRQFVNYLVFCTDERVLRGA